MHAEIGGDGMNLNKKAARVAGHLYLLLAITGAFGIVMVPLTLMCVATHRLRPTAFGVLSRSFASGSRAS
jgi:hypothetical protein